MNAISQPEGFPIIVDSFAGGGGASEGIEAAIRELIAEGILPADHPDFVTIAINHDDAAIAMHEANHPRTRHLPHNVWQVSLREEVGRRRIGLLWMSPDCRHHSKAKGGAPVSRSVRDLAWVAMRWLAELRPEQKPEFIFLENVEEFQKWGPLMPDGKGGEKPDPAREGETFKAWVKELKRQGYRRVEWRELRACPYGTPTIRKRLCLVAARDGHIPWPEETHGAPKSEEVREGKLQPWPVAADIIDWSRPCPSILMTKEEARAYTKATGIRLVRPLADKTQARIAKGVKRYVLDAAEPFVVTCNHGGEGFRGQSIHDPFATVTKARDAHGVVIPHLAAYYGHGNGGADRSAAADEPIRTVTTAPRHASIEASLAPFVTYGQQGGLNRSAENPMHCITASTKDTNCIAVPYLVPRYGERQGQEPRTRSAEEPAPTIVPTGNGGDLAAVYLAQHNENRIGQPMGEPAPTMTTRGTQTHQVAAFLAQHNNDSRRINGVNPGRPMTEPLATILAAGSQQGPVVAMLSHAYSSSETGGNGDPRAPLKTVTADGNHHMAVTLPLMTAYYSTGENHASVSDPMRTVTTKDRFGLTETDAARQPLSEAQLDRARQVAEFLRAHECWDGGEFVTIELAGEAWIVVDIGMRMLTARELARAQGFPDTYQLAVPFNGGTLSDTEQRHKIGNSVCPPLAKALVKAIYRPRLARSEPIAPPPLFLEAAE